MATAGHNLSQYDGDKLPDAREFKIGLVVSEWNSEITESMYQGAHEALLECGVDQQNIQRCSI